MKRLLSLLLVLAMVAALPVISVAEETGSIYPLDTDVTLRYWSTCNKPMYGVIIAYKNSRPNKGIMGSEWVGFKHFVPLFTGRDFPRLLKNTFTISGLTIVVSSLPSSASIRCCRSTSPRV